MHVIAIPYRYICAASKASLVSGYKVYYDVFPFFDTAEACSVPTLHSNSFV